MYGKKRIVITDKKLIVLAGNKTWNPIGKYGITFEKTFVGRLRKVEIPFETRLDDTNSVIFEFNSIGELRSFIKTTYASELI